MDEKQNVSFIKLTKEEKQEQEERIRLSKKEAYEKIPEQDKEKQKKYKRLIAETLVLFVIALIVLALLVTGVIPVPAGIAGLLVIALLSTYISRRHE